MNMIGNWASLLMPKSQRLSVLATAVAGIICWAVIITYYPRYGTELVPLILVPILIGAWALEWRATIISTLFLICGVFLINTLLADIVVAIEQLFSVGVLITIVATFIVALMRGLIVRLHQQSTLLSAERASLQREIAERQKTEEALRQSEARYRAIVQDQTELICRFQPGGVLTFVNDAYCHYFSKRYEDLIGQTFLPLIPEEDRQPLEEHYTRFSPDNPMITMEHRVIFANGDIRWMQWTDRAIYSQAGELLEFQAVGRDVTERRIAEEEIRRLNADLEKRVELRTVQLANAVNKLQQEIEERQRAETNLHESQQRLQLALRAAKAGAWAWNLGTNQTVWSEGNYLVLGLKPGSVEPNTENWLACVHPEDQQATNEQVADALEKHQDLNIEFRVIWPDGSVRWINSIGQMNYDESGQPVGVYGIQLDITERKQAESVLMQAHKMESLGILAGGVAHDFNNLLVAILGQASLALRKSPADSAANKHLEKAVHAAEQAAELTRQLLAYSGRGQFKRQLLELNDLIRNNQPLLMASISKRVRIQLDLEETLPMIEADPSQMQQVIMNLILNAAEAIGDQGGAVTVRTGYQVVGAADGRYWQHTGVPLVPGRYILLEVSDTGCGIAPELLDSVFEPFFTTKPSGRGLGLAAILGIVRGHNGGLHLQSQPGQGTTFSLVFPFSYHQSPPPAAAPEVAAHSNGSGKVLIIDDETYVHDLVAETMALEGIQVLAASGGVEGINVYRERQVEIGLVMLDLSMPDMSGAETFQKLRDINPNVRVILSSGFDKADVIRQSEWRGLTDFMQKPYNLTSLIDTVSRHLL